MKIFEDVLMVGESFIEGLRLIEDPRSFSEDDIKNLIDLGERIELEINGTLLLTVYSVEEL